jgi:hypothetical protein
MGHSSLGSMLRKKFNYGRTAETYLVRARSVGAKSAQSIVRSSVRAYARNWRLVAKHPAHYLGIFPLRAMEFAAIRVGMWFGPRAVTNAGQFDATPSSHQETH